MIKAYAATALGGKLAPFEYEPGPLAAGEVDIKVAYCGICHSDMSMLNNEWGMTQYPFVPGHEVAGTISAVGEGVTHLQVGQKVGLGWHAGYCQTCSACLGGDHNLCASAVGTIVSHHGGFGDAVRAQAVSVVPLPEGIDLESAGPLFCAGVTVFNPLLQYDVSPTAKVGVIGIGGLGHLALMFLKAWGCHVTAFTSSGSKEEAALAMGAHDTVDSRDPKALEAVAGQYDLILSTVNVKLDWNGYMAALAPKGKLHMLGVTLDPLDLDVVPMLFGQRTVSSSPVGSPASIAKMLTFAARHQIKPIVETFPMSEVNEALEHLESGKARYRIVLKN